MKQLKIIARRRKLKSTPKISAPNLSLEGVIGMLEIMGGVKNRVAAYMLKTMDERYEVHQSNKEIGLGSNAQISTVSTNLHLLKDAGFLDKVSMGRWRVSRKLLVLYGKENLTYLSKQK